MNESLLNHHIANYLANQKENPTKAAEEAEDRASRLHSFRQWNRDRMMRATPEELVEFFTPLWSMAMWGNKEYQVNQFITDNGLDQLRFRLAEFLWGSAPVEQRWNVFRSKTKWIGPSMMSELLGYVHPDECIIWNKATVACLNYLGYEGLPQKSHQMKGDTYARICTIAKDFRDRLASLSESRYDLLEVNYLLWDEIFPAAKLEDDGKAPVISKTPELEAIQTEEVAEFLHDDVKEKIADIGKWLGFNARIEVLVSAGSKVDAVWEATIGNMGRVIYVFEVQTKGSIDSLILNLLKSKKNVAVQGVVAVSDAKQLAKIRSHAEDVNGLGNLTYWDYTDVIKTHERLEAVNETINALNLVPKGFGK